MRQTFTRKHWFLCLKIENIALAEVPAGNACNPRAIPDIEPEVSTVRAVAFNTPPSRASGTRGQGAREFGPTPPPAPADAQRQPSAAQYNDAAHP